MRFMVIRKADADTEQGLMPSDELIQQMTAFNQELANAGVLIDGQGLQPSKEGARISFRNGEASITDGPFTETKELIAGYTMIQVKDKAEAIAWMQRWPKLDANGNVTLELRRVFELEDFEPGVGIEQTKKLFDRLAKQPQSAATYLMFNGCCRQAFEFYAQVLGGEILTLSSYAELPASEAESCGGSAHKDAVMHACLSYGSGQLMGTDAMTDYQPPQGFYQQLEINEPERAQQVFAALSEGGQVHMPFAETFWAKGFGMLVDAYGIPWMINCQYKATHSNSQ